MDELQEVWVYLNTTPLLHLTLTLLAFQGANWLFRKCGRTPLLNPVMVSVVVLVAFLLITGTSYGAYFEGAQFVHFLLGPATVCLAIPLYRQFEKVRKSALAIMASLFVGSLTAIASAIGIAMALGASQATLSSLAPKSVTAPVAMGVTEQLGGLPSLTAVLVILTGILGAMIGPVLLTKLGIRNEAARGFAIGTASHGIGTARALQLGEVSGAFAGLAMGLNALATAILLPLLWGLIF
ncbi:LrgB family protein [Actibacterium pelagium]|uniref:Membrane protein n=1 Tax=Actibacterium pelagium TaxID=2029103 RepID=A0A917ADB2_9RHOB|nr:LrgB family protein [Actibacterium pelagium]GGE39974.1 membrane protein [Actibacterium pelagium]